MRVQMPRMDVLLIYVYENNIVWKPNRTPTQGIILAALWSDKCFSYFRLSRDRICIGLCFAWNWIVAKRPSKEIEKLPNTYQIDNIQPSDKTLSVLYNGSSLNSTQSEASKVYAKWGTAHPGITLNESALISFLKEEESFEFRGIPFLGSSGSVGQKKNHSKPSFIFSQNYWLIKSKPPNTGHWDSRRKCLFFPSPVVQNGKLD